MGIKEGIMSEKSKKILIEILIRFTGIVFCLVWYDWKLLVILFFVVWGNNMMIKNKKDGGNYLFKR